MTERAAIMRALEAMPASKRAVVVQAAEVLRAARLAGDKRPDLAIVGPMLAQAGIDPHELAK